MSTPVTDFLASQSDTPVGDFLKSSQPVSARLPTPAEAVQVANDRAQSLVQNLQTLTLPNLPAAQKPVALMNDAEKRAHFERAAESYAQPGNEKAIGDAGQAMTGGFDAGPVLRGGTQALHGATGIYKAAQPGAAVQPDELARNASDVLRGTMEAGTVLLPGAIAAAPVKTAATIGTAMLAGKGGEAAATKLGASPGVAALAGDAAAIAGGGLVGKGTGLLRDVAGEVGPLVRKVQQNFGEGGKYGRAATPEAEVLPPEAKPAGPNGGLGAGPRTIDVEPGPVQEFLQKREVAKGGPSQEPIPLETRGETAPETVAKRGAGINDINAPENRLKPVLPGSPAEPVQEFLQKQAEVEPTASGNAGTTRTISGTKAKFEYQLVDAGKVRTSFDDGYNQDLQPRDTDRVASQMRILDKAKNLDFGLMAESPLAADGAPILGPNDNNVETRNHGVESLRLAYNMMPKQAAQYKADLKERAPEFGLDPAAVDQLKQPMLIRRRVDEFPAPADRLAFVRDANERSTAAPTPTELAAADANKLSGDLMGQLKPSESGEMNTAANAPFLRRFLGEVVGPTESGSLQLPDGTVSKSGLDRVRNAVFAKAYGDSSIVERLTESTDDNVRNVTTAMLRAAPKFATLNDFVKSGDRYDLSLAPELARATSTLSSLRANKMSLDDHLAQMGLQGEGDPVERRLLEVFGKYGRSSSRIQQVIGGFADAVDALGSPQQESIFGSEAPHKLDVLDAVVQGVDQQHAIDQAAKQSAGGKADSGAAAAEVPGQVRSGNQPGGQNGLDLAAGNRETAANTGGQRGAAPAAVGGSPRALPPAGAGRGFGGYGAAVTREAARPVSAPVPVTRVPVAPVPVAPKAPTPRERVNLHVAERLRAAADGLQNQIDAKRDPAIGRQNLTARRARIAAAMGQQADSIELSQKQLRALADLHESGTVPEVLSQIRSRAALEELRPAYEGAAPRYGNRNAERLKANGITARNFDEAARAAAELSTAKREKSAAEKTRELERGLIGRKIEGFFPTPRPVIDKMLQAADVQPGMSVLEPSAGKGDISDALREKTQSVTSVERNSDLRSILEAKGHKLAPEHDFLEHHGGGYDRVVMNPPFERGQDIEHVRHAFDRLKPGGRLVALMGEGSFFRDDAKAREFRGWLDAVRGHSEKLAEGSFTGKEAFRQTGVASRMVVIDKPEARGERGSFSNKPTEPPVSPELAEVAAHYNDKLQADRLSAQMRAPVSREEQLRKLKRDKTDRQGDMFGPTAEEPRQGGLFGDEKGSVNLADLDSAVRKKLGADGPKMNYSGLGALQDRYVRNLSQLEKVSPKAHQAAVRTASSRVQATVLLRAAVPAIQKAMGEAPGSPTWNDLKAVLVESRLRGIRDRWGNLAGQARVSSVAQLRASFDNGLMGILENIEGMQGIPQDVSQTAAALLHNADQGDLPSFTGLREFLAKTFSDAGKHVARVVPEQDFDRLIEHPALQRGLDVYKDKVEHHLAESHSMNEGIFSTALGPMQTYYPLVPLTEAEAERARPSIGAATPYRKPRNPSNEFATGLASEYDLGTEKLRDKIAQAFKANDKAALIQGLEDEGLLRILGPNERVGDTINIGGVDYQATVLETRGGRQTLKGGKTAYLPAQAAVVPAWLKKELDPILEQKDMQGLSAARIASSIINRIALSGPVDFAAHSANLLGTAIANTPFLGTSLMGKALSAPVIKKFTAIVKMMAIDPTSDEAVNDLQEMAKLGLLPEKYGSKTFSRKVAEQSGADLERFSFGPALYGPKGMDVRARLLMYRLAKEINPDITPLQTYHFVNQMGNYTTALQGAVERSLKASGWSPFYTAGSTMMRNGVNAWLGTGPMPKGGWGLRVAQALSGGAVGMVAMWVLLHEAYRGELPWHDKKNKLLSFRALPRDRYSALGRKLWGNGPEDGYFGLSFFNPLVGRGARALGIAGAYDTARAGGNAQQSMEAAAVGSANAVLHPVMGPPARSVFAGIFGKETTLTGLRDAQSQPGPQFMPAVPKGGSQFPHVGAAFREMNQFYANVGAATGLRSLRPAFEDKGANWLRVITDLATPALVSRPSGAEQRARTLHRQSEAEDRAAARAGR